MSKCEYYTRGHKFLGKRNIEFLGKEFSLNIYKSKTRDASKTRFLIWFNEHDVCAIVWKDNSLHINDVGKTDDGRNWYSYSTHRVDKIISDTPKELKKSKNCMISYSDALNKAFSEKVFETYMKLAS